jgi:hypothetical protein
MSRPPVSITAAGRPGADAPATVRNQLLAGFIVWLARRPLPAERRRELHREVERFLRWQTSPGQAHCGAAEYPRQLRQAGHNDAELTITGEAIHQLRAHLTEQRAHHRAGQHS